MCKNGQVTGVDTTVCDEDVPPEVTMKDLVSARVHRKGQLKSSATVNVTVYCVVPSSVTTPGMAPEHDTQSTYEVLSSELILKEVLSNEVKSIETVPKELTSNELKPKVVTSITKLVLTPATEAPTPHTEPTVPSAPEEVTPAPEKPPHTGPMPPHTYKLTIKITPPSKKGKKKRRPHSHKVRVPSSNKKEVSTVYIDTPPRISMMTPQNPGAPPQYTEASQQYAGAPPQYAGPPPHYEEAPPHYEGAPPQYPGPPSRYEGVPPLYAGGPPHFEGASPQNIAVPPQYHHMPPPYKVNPAEYTVTSVEYVPPMYNVIPPPVIVAPLYRPISLLGPRLRFWSRQKPGLQIRHF